MRWWLCPCALVPLVCMLCGCARAAPVDLAGLSDRRLFAEMQWVNTDPPTRIAFGEGGRDAHIAAVRAEILHRRPQWSPEAVERIHAGRVEVDMMMEQVVAAIGWPNEYPGLLWAFRPRGPFDAEDDLMRRSERVRARQWSYGKAPSNLWVFFDEGWRVWRIIDNRVGG